MLRDLGLQTKEQIQSHKDELFRRFDIFNKSYGHGCIGSRVCDGCNHLISDSVCLCLGYFICPNCGFENGKSIKIFIENSKRIEGNRYLQISEEYSI